MSEPQRAPWDFYTPTDRATMPRNRMNAPVEQPSLSELWSAGATLARGDLPTADVDRLYDAWSGPLEELNRGRGLFRRYQNPFAAAANSEIQLTDETGSPFLGPRDRDAEEGRLWAAVEARRATDPKAFPALPKTLEEFHDQVLRREQAARAQARGTIARNGTWLGTATTFAAGVPTSFRDPINIAALPLGGVGRTLATRLLTAGLANMAVEAVEQPFVARQREKLGEELTGREAATNIAAAGVFGSVFQGGTEGIGRLGARALATGPGQRVASAVGGAVGRGAELARAARERIGWTRMTDAERQATATLERDAEVAATTPTTGGGAVETHLSRVDEAMRHIDDPAAFARAMAGLSPERPANLSRADAGRAEAARGRVNSATYADQVGKVESGGRWDAQAGSSSAYGLYQITRGTWLRYADAAGVRGASDAATWNARTNPAAQEAVFAAITRDNRAALTRAGVPETAGNLYLMHFAGAGAGTKVLRAARETPLADILSARAIEANPHLKGKTAGELIDWAHRKMGDAPVEGPVLRRDGFSEDDAGDAEWLAAQREVDAAEARLRETQREAIAADRDNDPLMGTMGDDDPAFDVPGFDEPFVPTRGDPFEEMADDVATTRSGDSMAVDEPGPAPAAPDAYVARKVGNFYEIAGDLAEPSARALEVAVTRNRAGEASVAIPAHAADRYLAALQDAGISVRLEGREPAPIVRTPIADDATPIRIDDVDPDEPPVSRAAFAAERSVDDAPIAREGEAPAGNAFPVRAPDALDGGAPRLEGYDSPDGVAAQAQMDSLEHDLRMWLAEDEAAGVTVRLSEEGDVLNAADVLDDLDADDAAIEAARACMVPGGVA